MMTVKAVKRFTPSRPDATPDHSAPVTADKSQAAMQLIALSAASVIIVLSRIATYRMPANVDVSLVQVISHELMQGRGLYTELWDNKPPLAYAAYAAAELLVGWGDAQILLLGAVLSIITLLGVWYAGTTAGPLGGLIAAALWTIVHGDLALEAQHPNGEAFLNALLAWVIALLVHGRTRWAPAVLFALLSLTKLNAVIFPAYIGIAHVASARDRSQALRDIRAWLLVGVAAWMSVGGYFLLVGRLEHFVEAIFIYNSYYKGSLSVNLIHGMMGQWLFNPILLGLAPAAALAAGGLLLAVPRRNALLLTAGVAGAWCAVSSPGYFFFHYYQQYMPFIVTGAGWGAAVLVGRTGRIAWIAVGSTLLVSLAIQVPNYLVWGDEWIRRAMGHDSERYIAQQQTIPVLKKLLRADDTMYQVGSQSAYYVATRSSPPTGVLFLKHMAAGPAAAALNRDGAGRSFGRTAEIRGV
jgi:hypothetical protein